MNFEDQNYMPHFCDQQW